MRILHIYKTSLPESFGGVESFINTLCKADSLLGVKNSVLSLSSNPKKHPINMDGYTVHQAKSNLSFASVCFSISAFKIFHELADQSDIIHYHFPNPFCDLLHFSVRPKKPSLVTYHSDIVRQKYLLRCYQPLRKLFLSSVNDIVATSPNYFNSSQVLQAFADRVSVIPIGIDINSISAIDEKRLAHWRQQLKRPFFLFVGALRYYKGLHVALNAVANTDIGLVIAGKGGVENELKAQAESLGLSNVDFLGFVDDEDKFALLQLCTGFVFPSHLRSEAFGISLLEAAAYGKPLITCEIGTGTTYVNIANETGMVVSPSNSVELKEAMKFLLQNPEAASRMGQNAKHRALKVFSAKKQALLYFQVYQRLLEGR